MFAYLNKIEDRLDELIDIVDKQYQQEVSGKQYIPYTNKTIHFLKQNIVEISVSVVCLTILFTIIFEYFFSIETCRILSIILNVLHLPIYAFLIFIKIQQVHLLQHRKASLKDIFVFFMIIPFIFGDTYYLLQISNKQAFYGIILHLENVKFINLYFECYYYAWLNLLSIGFGELYANSLPTRIVALIESQFSWVYLTVLLSNWIS